MSRPDRERQMLDIAEEVFAEQGYRAASMDDIAERVGVSKPMLYEYFGSKDGLLSACVARIRTDLYEATEEAMAGAGSPEDVLWRGLLAYFTFMDRHNRALAVIAQEPMLIPAAAADAIEATRRQQSGLTASLLAAFAPDVPPRAVEAYAEIIIGACERVSLWRARRPEVTPEEAARHVMDFSWRGLRALAAPGLPGRGRGDETSGS
jgi:AcrR family transcriptional regulator